MTAANPYMVTGRTRTFSGKEELVIVSSGAARYLLIVARHTIGWLLHG